MIKVLELFGGIGACTEALKNIGVEFEVVDYVEIDKYSVKSYNAMNGTNFEPQDIQTWNKDVDVDLIMHGSPCQDFSVSGLNRGGDEGSGTRSSLMYETIRIVEKIRPKYVIWENVKNLISKKHKHNFDAYLERMSLLGYTNHWKVLNSKDFDVPQNRERVFTISILGGSMAHRSDGQITFDDLLGDNSEQVAFEFPKPIQSTRVLRDILEPSVSDNYYLSEKTLKYICATGTKDFYYKPEIDLDIARPITATMHKMHRASQDNYLSDSYINNGVKVDIENGLPKIKQVAQMYGDGNSNPQSGRIYSVDGISPTLDTASGGNLTPKLLVKNNTVQGYQEAHEGDGVDLQFLKSNSRRGRVQSQISQTLPCCGEIGVVVTGIDATWNKLGNTTDVARTLTTACKTLSSNQMTTRAAEISDTLRIRRLTPLECWRLQAFSDESFYKAQQVNSNTQLYKQAGNSITVKVIEHILLNLLEVSNE